VRKHPGAVRLLGFLCTPTPQLRASHSLVGADRRRAGYHRDAPERDAEIRRRAQREQELTKDIGVFGRLGWNDGKTESFAFTAIDRLEPVASP